MLPAVLLAALLLTPKDIPFDGAGIAFVGNSITLGGNASSPSTTYASLVTDFLSRRSAQEQRRMFLSFDPSMDVAAAADAMKHDRRYVVVELGVHAAINETVSADTFRQIYASLLDCVTGSTTIVVAGTIPWLGWAAVDPIYERADEFSQIIIQEATKRQIAVADLWTETRLRLDLISTPQEHTFVGSGHGDNVHPNDAGHTVIAQAYERAITLEVEHPPKRGYDRTCH